MAEDNEISASEALYGFCGWLTTREQQTVMSAKDDAGIVASLVNDFCSINNFSEPRENWSKKIIHPK